MSRLTITWPESRYRALEEAAARRRKTIGQLIDELTIDGCQLPMRFDQI